MVRVIHMDDDGTEVAEVELDDFTIEILYSGIATMLRDAAAAPMGRPAPSQLSREALQRRARILNRIHA